MSDFASNNMSQNSPEFEPRVQKLLILWDAIAKSGSSVEGLLVMASVNALPSIVANPAVSFQRWVEQNNGLLDSVEQFREGAARKLAEIVPGDETHWRELVAFAFSMGVQLGGWNVAIVDDPELTAAHNIRKDVFQNNYFAAKAAAGFTTDSEVAAAAEISRGTVLGIEKHGIVPRRETIDRLANAFGLSKGSDLFRGLEDVDAWRFLFE